MTGRRASLARGAGAVIVLALLGNGLAAAAGPEPGEGAVFAPSGAVVAARVAISPVIVRLEAARGVGRGRSALELSATVVNLGDQRLSDVVVSVAAWPEEVALRPDHSRTVRRLAPGDATVSTWAVCTTVPGTYSLVAIATIAGVPTDSRPLLLTLDAAARC